MGERGPLEGETGRRDSWARSVTPGVGPRVGPWMSCPEPAHSLQRFAYICIHLHILIFPGTNLALIPFSMPGLLSPGPGRLNPWLGAWGHPAAEAWAGP